MARRAYVGEVDELADMVISCVAADPRWDGIDSRDDYYARLALLAGVSPSVFDSMVTAEENEPHENASRAPLALQVLSRMASLGDPEALAASRRYIGAGRYWDEVLLELSHGPGWELHPDWEARVGDLGPVLMGRWATEEEMLAETGRLVDADPDDAPWSALTTGQPALRSALEAGLRDLTPSDTPSRRAMLPSLPTSQLLEHDEKKDVRRAAQALASRSFTAAETALLQEVANDPSAPMHPAAVATLARMGRTDMLEATLAFASAQLPGRGLLFRAFSDLPLDVTRPHVIDWLTGPDHYRRRAAASALERHATPADLTLVRERLAVESGLGVDGDQYVICDLASALGRHPPCGPFPEITAAYEAMPYSFGRHYVVDAMAATDPTFPTASGIDCLWDGEAAVRSTASNHVDRGDPDAAARIDELRTDEREDPAVRAAAA